MDTFSGQVEASWIHKVNMFLKKLRNYLKRNLEETHFREFIEKTVEDGLHF